MWFSVEGQPQGKGRPRFTRRGHVYTPDRTKEYEELIALRFKESNKGETIKGACEVWVTAFYGIPDSFSKKKKQEAVNGLIFPTVKPDADNVLKIVMDALNGVAYEDDKQVVKAICDKRYGENPRIEVAIYEVKKWADRLRESWTTFRLIVKWMTQSNT